MMENRRGLTLIELLITMAIIFILASVALPISKLSAKRAKELELRQNLRVLRGAIDRFKRDWDRAGNTLIGEDCRKNQMICKEVSSIHGYPKLLGHLLKIELSGTVDLTPKRYLRRIPTDPITQTEWGLRCYKDEANAENRCEEDVFDVHTQSQEMALDGTPYRDW